MNLAHARSVQLPSGALEAQLLLPGDKILLRRPGADKRTVETVWEAIPDMLDTLIRFEWGVHRTSRTMQVALAPIPRPSA